MRKGCLSLQSLVGSGAGRDHIHGNDEALDVGTARFPRAGHPSPPYRVSGLQVRRCGENVGQCCRSRRFQSSRQGTCSPNVAEGNTSHLSLVHKQVKPSEPSPHLLNMLLPDTIWCFTHQPKGSLRDLLQVHVTSQEIGPCRSLMHFWKSLPL